MNALAYEYKTAITLRTLCRQVMDQEDALYNQIIEAINAHATGLKYPPTTVFHIDALRHFAIFFKDAAFSALVDRYLTQRDLRIQAYQLRYDFSKTVDQRTVNVAFDVSDLMIRTAPPF